ncbi:tripartite tricarboxylate transporter substrate binding protein [Noviherbaspirillum sp. CPCC 100848]|uniref:Tripartite tricarboxylate transporter substrate binding protein n=1 Tax=Noviherbaspirillum album TaxID=3080276 RepID=A0ABU6J9M4_9BURK|nr:tripartite tricarboxylate transporter substrate binding protein [Noviherbaspirillum sp. CPCC 100848]MEC4720354.1 tripartite tricarboxylate transporter substrate binding protein [Noviherbaspirillum sp. CPCC 100848]
MKHAISKLMTGVVLAAGAAASFANPAEGYPKATIKIIVNFPAGGTADILPRIIAQKLSDKWGQPVIVENRTGAGGNIGAEAVAKAAPDGYTLLATPPAPLAINQYLYKSLPFDPARFEPVTVLATVPNVLAVRANLPVKTAKDFIAYAKKEDGMVTVATQGNGTTSHLTASMFATQSGTKYTFVPYKGTAPALTDLMGGQVDVFFDNIASMSKLHETGKARILAVASANRSPLLPNMPTLSESVLPGFNASTFFAMAAPPGTPAEITQKLNGAIKDILKQKDVQQKFLEQGAEIVGNSPAEMKDFVMNERVRWKKVIDSAGVTMN